jgi:quinol monooxygenase YgiN
MPTAIVKIKIKAGREADFEDFARNLVKVVNEKEPGVRFYQAFGTSEPGHYCFLESFIDEEASKAHVKSDHFRAIRPALVDFFDGAPDVQRLSDI